MNGKLDFFYYNTHEPRTYVDFHQHRCFELVYYVSGSGTMNLDGKKLRYTPGSMTLTRPNHLHDERHDERTEVIFFGFRYDEFPVALNNGIVHDSGKKDILRLMLAMKEEVLGRERHYELRLDLLVNEIILLLGRQAGDGEPDDPAGKLSLARGFIEEHYSQPVNLRTLAEISGYSNDHFRHLFKRETGLSPLNFIMRKRVEEAKRRLLGSAASVSAVAMDCGFSTTSQFIEKFKELTGTTPLRFRREGGGAQPATRSYDPPPLRL